ncbi:MAG: glycosyltransferase family 2 protein [Anditalea sp.]
MSFTLPIIDVIIPAFNEQNSIGLVVREIPDYVRNIVVVNNNSSDETKKKAISAGATVVDEPQQGYGKACLKGMDYIKALEIPPKIVVFLDADYSDYPREMSAVVRPIIEDKVDFVIGSRSKGEREGGSMTFPQIFGNWLATTLMRWFYQADFSDLGPFRAIKWDRLLALNMKDQDFGWTIEMQIKAVKSQLKITEVPVNYKKRIGTSKVSGTVKGTILAGYKIIWTIFKYL